MAIIDPLDVSCTKLLFRGIFLVATFRHKLAFPHNNKGYLFHLFSSA